MTSKWLGSAGCAQQMKVVTEVNDSRKVKHLAKDKGKVLAWRDQKGELLKTIECLYYFF